jgi:hypothetical protein
MVVSAAEIMLWPTGPFCVSIETIFGHPSNFHTACGGPTRFLVFRFAAAGSGRLPFSSQDGQISLKKMET